LKITLPQLEIIDIGARKEGIERFAGLMERYDANLTGFEPNPTEFEILQAAKTLRRRYFPFFLGTGERRTFYITRYPGCCSLLEPDPSVIDLFQSIGATLPGGNFAVTKTEEVQSTRLDDIDGLPNADFIKLDVQGAELDILKNGVNVLRTVTVVETEVEFVPLYKGQPLFGDIQTFMREQGFVFHKFVDVVGRAIKPFQVQGSDFAPMSQMLWADAIFVRDYTRPNTYSDDQLIKAAAVLYEVYHSFDLVHLLLSIYDQRKNTSLASRYASALGSLAGFPLLYLNVKLES